LEAIHDYKGAVYASLNKHLRSARRRKDTELERVDELMQIVMGMQRWKHPGVRLYRCLYGAYAKKLLSLSVGDEFTNEAYSSTAFDMRHAMTFGVCDVLLVVSVPAGTPFMYIDGYRDLVCKKRSNKEERWVYQSEVVLDKHSTFKIKKVTNRPVDFFYMQFNPFHNACRFSQLNTSLQFHVMHVDLL
jgi:hypothetical protein